MTARKAYVEPQWRHMRKPWEERIFARSAPDENGCWIYQGVTDPEGYGRFSVGGTKGSAHRWAYAAAHGPIPAGLEIDHLCFVRNCINPGHLEAVTRAENHRRMVVRWRENPPRLGVRAKSPRCRRGHERTDENTHVREDGGWECRPCRRAREKRKYDRRRTSP